MIIKNVKIKEKITDIQVENGRFTHIGDVHADGGKVIDGEGLKLIPGLIDIHSHGCLGYDTMEGNLPEMAAYQLAHGITTWYPTTMTMSFEDIRRATEAPITGFPGAHIPGFHLEGPFISKKYKGAQNEEFIKAPTMELLKECKNVKLITLAPELAGSEEFIRACGIVVALGHTACDYDTAVRAFRAGATCLTHTFNAMTPLHHREPGPIPAAADCGAYAQLISDGIHVHPAMVRLLFRLFGDDRVVLISDSLRATGLDDGEFMFGGQKVILKDGVARIESGAIAGSTTDLFECMRRAVSFGIPEETAIRAASENPARLMGLNKGKIEVGYDADFLLVTDDLRLVKVFSDGVEQK
ncbi:MAG TPA: N-acetylglucosamine-6-phosphate deacetylase [Clostridiales bacterium]|nr:N-acetylglucosamine-6-phosphate deacetylase [Clostridiales bacterium]